MVAPQKIALMPVQLVEGASVGQLIRWGPLIGCSALVNKNTGGKKQVSRKVNEEFNRAHK